MGLRSYTRTVHVELRFNTEITFGLPCVPTSHHFYGLGDRIECRENQHFVRFSLLVLSSPSQIHPLLPKQT